MKIRQRRIRNRLSVRDAVPRSRGKRMATTATVAGECSAMNVCLRNCTSVGTDMDVEKAMKFAECGCLA